MEGPRRPPILVWKVLSVLEGPLETPDPRVGDPRFWKVLFGRSFGRPPILEDTPDLVFWVWKVLFGGPPILEDTPDSGLEGPLETPDFGRTSPIWSFGFGRSFWRTPDFGRHPRFWFGRSFSFGRSVD